MSSMFKGPDLDVPENVTDEEAQAAAKAEAERLRKLRGYRSTIFAGEQSGEAQVKKATLGS